MSLEPLLIGYIKISYPKTNIFLAIFIPHLLTFNICGGVYQAGHKLWKAVRLHPPILFGDYAQSLMR